MKLHRLALLSVGPVAGLVFGLAACAAPADDDAASATSDLTGDALASRVAGALRAVEQRSGGKNYVATDRFVIADLPHGMPNALAAGPRRQALLDCVVYGGGAAPASSDEPEQLDKYLSAAERAAIAAEIDAAIGDAAVVRLNSFGVGDPGDDFSARCTVGVRLAADDLLMLHGHGRDRL